MGIDGSFFGPATSGRALTLRVWFVPIRCSRTFQIIVIVKHNPGLYLRVFLNCIGLLVDLGPWDPARSIENARAINPVKFSAQKLFRVSSYDHFIVFTMFFLTNPHPLLGGSAAAPRRPTTHGSLPRLFGHVAAVYLRHF